LAEENKEPDAEVIEIVEDDDEMAQDNTQAMDTTL
jgi:hypothetical protein